jgi:hypothetical protein
MASFWDLVIEEDYHHDSCALPHQIQKGLATYSEVEPMTFGGRKLSKVVLQGILVFSSSRLFRISANYGANNLSFLIPKGYTNFIITQSCKTSILVSLFCASSFMLNLPRKQLSGSFRGRKEKGATRILTADQSISL